MLYKVRLDEVFVVVLLGYFKYYNVIFLDIKFSRKKFVSLNLKYWYFVVLYN